LERVYSPVSAFWAQARSCDTKMSSAESQRPHARGL
jgi:hypothetical protein